MSQVLVDDVAVNGGCTSVRWASCWRRSIEKTRTARFDGGQMDGTM